MAKEGRERFVVVASKLRAARMDLVARSESIYSQMPVSQLLTLLEILRQRNDVVDQERIEFLKKILVPKILGHFKREIRMYKWAKRRHLGHYDSNNT